MHLRPKHLAAGALALAVSQAAIAGTNPYFSPLTQSSAVASPDHVNELNSPWQTPAGISQTRLMSLVEVENDVLQSIQRTDGDGRGNPAGRNASMFDMLAYSPSGRYIYIPHETGIGAGLSRYDSRHGITELIFAGNELGDRNDVLGDTWAYDYGAFDPARMTPNQTVIAAEEWSGQGRVVEVMKPYAEAPDDPVAGSPDMQPGVGYRELTSIAKVSHEGINFSLKHWNKVIFFIDEDRSGSIYKLVLNKAGDYMGGGQTFVLVVDGFTGNADERWDGSGSDDSDVNKDPEVQASRFGPATWVPITDTNGVPLPGVRNPFDNSDLDDSDQCVPSENRCQPSARPGRDSADDVNGTPYGRPEDMTIGESKHGNEMLYVTTTSENAVISIENYGGHKAMVRQFASTETPKNLGYAPTTGELNSPDNLAQDGLGNIYIIEDSPNSGDVGGDVWFARDLDNDGVAESIDHFISLQVNGSEATGMIFHPKDPSKFVIAVQHPTTTDITTDGAVGGQHGDAVWEFDIAGVHPPKCDGGYQYSHYGKHKIRTCTKARDVNYQRKLNRAGPTSAYRP